MRWPPNKAWTSTSSRNGYRHFVAINYGGKGDYRWVSLVSVLDGNVCFKVEWREMTDPKLWLTGWLQLPREESIGSSHCIEDGEHDSNLTNQSCLHSSEDSGLQLPSKKGLVRPWEIEN